jgi:hypothetical protein
MEMEPLFDEKNAPRKRPIILYIIIGILLIVIIVLSILLAIKSSDKGKEAPKEEDKKEPFNPIKKDHFIPVNEFFYINDTGEYGAYSYQGIGNHLDSEYFKILDVYNMKSNKNRTILTHFKTYQQTSEYSSPCSLIIMILNYYNMEAPGERNCSLTFGLTPEEGCSKDNYDRTEVFNKTTIPLFAKQLTETYHLEVDICQNYNEETMPFKNEAEFGDWVKKQISEENIPIVLYNDWAGQYAAIIGIDNLGTPDTNDDVLILADAYDSTDHLQDGYTIWSLEKFYNLWQYSVIPFYKDDESINHGQWILVKKPKSN